MVVPYLIYRRKHERDYYKARTFFFLLIDNVLFHSRVAKAKPTKDMNQFQLVLPQCKIVDVLHLYHYSPLGGHCGIQDCLESVKEHYYFSLMAEVIADYVR